MRVAYVPQMRRRRMLAAAIETHAPEPGALINYIGASIGIRMHDEVKRELIGMVGVRSKPVPMWQGVEGERHLLRLVDRYLNLIRAGAFCYETIRYRPKVGRSPKAIKYCQKQNVTPAPL